MTPDKIQYSGILHLRKCILKIRDTRISLSHTQFDTSIIYEKLTPLNQERSHCIKTGSDSFLISFFLNEGFHCIVQLSRRNTLLAKLIGSVLIVQ